MARLRSHRIRLTTPRLLLRPMTEEDWSVLLRWNQDPRVLVTWNDGDVTPWKLDDLVAIYRTISQHAYMFMVERQGHPIGECWLQRLNLKEISRSFPRQNLFRVDLSIGESDQWGRGFGTEIVHALADFGFRENRADVLFACHVSDSNLGSRRVFEKNGFVEWGQATGPNQAKDGARRCHMILSRPDWEAMSRRGSLDRA